MMPASKTVSELLEGVLPLYDGDAADLAQWAKAVEESDTKLHAECDLARDTTGKTIPIENRVGPDADLEPGGFEDGWIAIPGHTSCPTKGCEGEQPALVLGNMSEDVIFIDCIGCRTRYDIEALAGGAT